MIGENLVLENKSLLAVSRYHIALSSLSSISLSKNRGSTLRGGFGNALKEVCCTVSHTPCLKCTLFRVCAYPTLFETPLPINGTRMEKGTAVPRPFVLETPLEEKATYAPGEVMHIGLVLIGRATSCLPYFVRAFKVLGDAGIGMGRGHFKVEQVQPLEMDEKPLTACRQITLRFLTPTRIITKGQASHDLDFPLLFKTLVRRIENLRVFHGVNQEETTPRKPPSHPEEIRVLSSKLRWLEQTRYSRRQQQNIPQSGFVGEISFEGDLGPFLPYLHLGECVHVGKGATFGMGRYEIVAEKNEEEC